MNVFGPSDAKTKAIQEMFERGDGVIRDLDAERRKFERMISSQSNAEQEYNRGKFNVDNKEQKDA
tara:strand:- start:257 stop:451 length:195 start_codon:yes stop_codon:yes gene_type:complete